MNAASLTKTIDRREQYVERRKAHDAVVMHRYTRMLSAKKLTTPGDRERIRSK